MSDSFTELTSTSWLSRIWQSITGVLFGLLFIAGAVILLFWNEGRAIQTARSLAEGGKVVTDVAPDAVDSANEGSLIHVSGDATVTAPLTDSEFSVSVVGLRLERTAEMYQWEEKKQEEISRSFGGSEQTKTTYTYNKVWSDHAIDSQNFRQRDDHTNPAKQYSRFATTATDARLGAFRLDAPVLTLLPTSRVLRVDEQTASALRSRARCRVRSIPRLAAASIRAARSPMNAAKSSARWPFRSRAVPSPAMASKKAASPSRTEAIPRGHDANFSLKSWCALVQT